MKLNDIFIFIIFFIPFNIPLSKTLINKNCERALVSWDRARAEFFYQSKISRKINSNLRLLLIFMKAKLS